MTVRMTLTMAVQMKELNVQHVEGNLTNKHCRNMQKYAKRYLYRKGKCLMSRNKGLLKMINKMTIAINHLLRRGRCQAINNHKKMLHKMKSLLPQSKLKQLNGKLKVKCCDKQCVRQELMIMGGLPPQVVLVVELQLIKLLTIELNAIGAAGSLLNLLLKDICLYVRKNIKNSR